MRGRKRKKYERHRKGRKTEKDTEVVPRRGRTGLGEGNL